MQNQREYTLKNGKSVVIRQPTLDDESAYIDYISLIFQDDQFFLTTHEESQAFRTPEKVRERITKSQDPSQGILLMAWDGNKAISMADLTRGIKKRNGHVGSLGISILPEYRGLGLGTAIIEHLIEWAQKDALLEKLTLSVYTDNLPAIKLYQKLDFQEEGRQKREMKNADGSYKDLILMSKFVK
jgi:RimJ/RimL family protein N-acetyltransferase